MELLDEPGDTSGDELKVNKKYAKRMKYSKDRQERERLEKKYGKSKKLDTKVENEDDDEERVNDMSDSDSEEGVEEDEMGDLITPEVDAQILKMIAMIRRQDPELYHKEMTEEFFDQAFLQSLKPRNGSKNNVPVTLKDYHARLLLDGQNGVLEDTAQLPPAREDALLKTEMTAAFQLEEDESSDEDLLVPKPDQKEEQRHKESSYRDFLEKTVGANDLKAALTVDEANKEEEDFLANYILKRGWVDNDTQDVDSEPDEDFEDQADRFESAYNFRFEQPGATEIISHSRDIEDSVRRQPEARKRQREAAAERKAAEKAAKREELKRLKNLRRQETEQRLNKIREILHKQGNDLGEDDDLQAADLEGDFDPEDYDKRMGGLFGETWYSKEDGHDDIKPQWDEDIDIDDLEGGKKRKHRADTEDRDEANHDVIEDSKQSMRDEKRKKAKLSIEEMKEIAEKEQARLEQEQYELDHEDMIGDLPTRFRYTTVPQETYGLSAVDILLADDADLNQHVGLRRIAPYREQNSAQREAKVLSKKGRLREFKKSLEEKGRQWATDDDDNQSHRRVKYSKAGASGNVRIDSRNTDFEATGANETPLRVRNKKRKGKRERKREFAKAEVSTET